MKSVARNGLYFATSSLLSCILICGSASAADGPMQLIGSIDSHYGVRMKLNISADKVDGSYSYLGRTASLKLSGKIDKLGKLEIKEFDPKGKNTGVFSGTLIQDKRITGIWKDPSQKPNEARLLPFLLAIESDYKSLGDGKDGIIMTQKVTKIHKSKDAPAPQNEAVVSYPLAMDKYVPSQSILPTLQKSLSTEKIIGDSVAKIAAEIKEGKNWLEEIQYQVVYNKNYLVNIEMTQSGCGAYPDSSVRRALISTKDGRSLSAKDLFVESSFKSLKAMIHKKLEENAQTQSKDLAAGSAEDKDSLRNQIQESFKYSQIDLSQFVLDDSGITFTYDWGFPHAIEALEPSGDCSYTFAELKPYIRKDGPLAQFLH